MNVLVVEWVDGLLVEFLLDLLREHVYVGFVYFLAFVDQLDGIVNADVLEFLEVLVPELIQNKKQLLSPARREDW